MLSGDFREGFSLKGEVNSVKQFIRHDYPDVEARIQDDGIRLYSLKDIAAMRLIGYCRQWYQVEEDFIDVAYLSGYLSLKEMLSGIRNKISIDKPNNNLKGLSYYDDIRFRKR